MKSVVHEAALEKEKNDVIHDNGYKCGGHHAE